jgi:16S rRNA (guanine527-N7)-methyltransferase
MGALGSLATLVRSWNDRVNLVSRKDAEHIEEHHIVMSLLMTKVWPAAGVAEVLDLGTGGGFPGIPLAICFPNVRFTLLDSIAKKARAVQDVVTALRLPNVTVVTSRAENVRQSFDLVVGRAVTALPQFLRWAGPLLKPGGGVLYFKGTRWSEELEGSQVRPHKVHDLKQLTQLDYFDGKFILHFLAPIQMEEHVQNNTNTNMHADKPKQKQKYDKKRNKK